MALERCTIHMWGLEEKPSLISPESIGLYWFLNGYYSKLQVAHEIEFVFSNNTDLSPNEELPLLVLGDNKISGFVNIVDYLMQDLTSEIDDKGTALLQSSLLQYTSSDLTVLTNYQLYLNKENYETFTRRHFCRLLYWPMWYNTPLHYRAVARERCEDLLGYLPSEEEEALSGSTEPSELAQSKTFKVTQQNKRKGKEELQNAKFNMQYLNKLSEHLKVWIQVRERAMSEKVIPADLLMWANIYVQLQLPDKDKVATHLSQTLGSDFFATLQKQLDLCSHFEPIIPFREPTFQEQGNAIMSIYNKGAKYL
ncbi:SAM complex subunit SAM37 TDEL_0B07190 [Torulaspora delbrueckii]|uniref:Mitochondrial outer membrane transport complex Sam37/metaxin N-terminal domain-containing protein n=1 Tax=Torulaspora delbrueckii TaxID=4950 RepID=G8ZQF4_TORDE|nr:hypothetical protein TDEL_0B07190 [Torulaspora delbrueckii]CCE90848.1 hypothetical protein TDEL_0B07190 [Torulaspora delbrueckii]